MVDTDLIVAQLRAKGYTVGHVQVVSENAGDYIFPVDGVNLDLEAARELLEADTAE